MPKRWVPHNGPWNIRFGMNNFRQAQRKFRGINCDQHIWILRDNIVRRFIQRRFKRGYCFRISTIPMTDNSCIANRLSIPRAIIRGPATPMKSAGCSRIASNPSIRAAPSLSPDASPRLMRFSLSPRRCDENTLAVCPFNCLLEIHNNTGIRGYHNSRQSRLSHLINRIRADGWHIHAQVLTRLWAFHKYATDGPRKFGDVAATNDKSASVPCKVSIPKTKPFSTTTPAPSSGERVSKRDQRVQYHAQHPRAPAPLKHLQTVSKGVRNCPNNAEPLPFDQRNQMAQ